MSTHVYCLNNRFPSSVGYLIDGFSLACQIHQISQRGEKRYSREVFTFLRQFFLLCFRGRLSR